jgi:hypothetical protein
LIPSDPVAGQHADADAGGKILTHVMVWVEELINDPVCFPEDPSVPSPKDFRDIVANILRRMFRVCHHQKHIKKKGLGPGLNTSFRHFYHFVKEFDLPRTTRSPGSQQSFARRWTGSKRPRIRNNKSVTIVLLMPLFLFQWRVLLHMSCHLSLSIGDQYGRL